jgi:uncharacterized alpha-E superfamily protein
MLSRVAESIYWMSRNVERAENLARFIEVTMNLMLDLPPDSAEQWAPLIHVCGDHDWFDREYGEASRANVINFLTFDTEYAHSIVSCLHSARDSARSVREVISTDLWEHLNHFYYQVLDAADNPQLLQSPQELLRDVKLGSHLFKGIADATMLRGEGWHFSQLGRLLERADKTSRILDVKYYILLPRVQDVGTSMDDLQWSAVLRSVDAFEMYRQRHHGISPTTIVEFLVLAADFPRAIYHCVDAAQDSLHAISHSPPGTFANQAEQQLGRLRGELAYTQVEEIVFGGLHEFLDSLQARLRQVGDAVHETFFATRQQAA